MISVADFLAIAAGQSSGSDLTNNVKLGTIDFNYVSGDPKVTFDGESTLSGRTYPTLSSYEPKPDDRVLLIRTGNTWLVAGSIGGYPLGDRVTALENDVADLKKGWNFIDAGTASSDFTLDVTAGGKYPAGTFNRIRVEMTPTMVTGNSWIVATVNNLAGATDYARGWWGESFDGVTSVRKVSNSGSRMVLGYISALPGSIMETLFYRTNFASDIPTRGFSNRGAPDPFDGNREFMHTTNVLNSGNVLLSTIQFFISSGNIADAEWTAEGFRV